ncbi:hypothetical protein [Agrobacterium tumefaciens]|uniref:hypothetical protein n=1 Tax=Agrobacterium tumefaciens TaxID=358 RepID=UPI0015717E47|nr:hypothetical protein [Agrobacterium tumefaciens]NSX90146.1 hypothetical protein [Agrobacterium tumefaciens]
MTDFATLVLNADSRGLVSGEQALDRFADTAERTENRTGKALDNVGRSAKELGKQSTYSSQALRMQAMQLSQVAQQATATGNVMQAIAIQLPDLALVFGPIGIAAGAAAGAVLSYFSSFDGAEESNVVLEEQIRLIKQVADNWGEAIPALREYADELERAKSLADLQTGGRLTVEAQYDKIREELEGFNNEYGRTLELLNSTDGTDESVMRLSVAYEDLQEKIRDGTATVEDFQRVQQAATEVAATKGFEDISGFASAFDGLTSKVMQSLGAIQQLQTALNGQARMLDPRTWRSAGMSGQDADGPIQGNGFILPEIGPVPGSRGTPELSGFPWENFNKRDRSSERAAKKYERERQAVADLIDELKEELSLVGATETAKRSAAAIRQAGAAATEDEKKAIADLITEIYAEQEARDRQIDTLEDYKDSVGSVLDDARSALADGKITWDEWADIALNALDKVINRIQDDLLNALFSVENMGSGGGGGGFLSSLFGGLFGGSTGGFAKLPSVGPVPIARPSFDGGGYTGSGSRSGGLDGKGGFWAMMHPDETVIDHTKGQSATSQLGGTSEVLVSLSPELVGQILEQAQGQTVKIVGQNNKNQRNLYQNGQTQDG